MMEELDDGQCCRRWGNEVALNWLTPAIIIVTLTEHQIELQTSRTKAT